MTSALVTHIATEMSLRPDQVERTITLLDEGNTVPFIARYRKEVTGGLDEVQIRAIQDRITYLRNLEERKETILRSIAEQGKLTPELEAAIRQTMILQELEDLYRPYRPKRRTRATIAREQGLEPLAQRMLAQEDEEGDLAAIAEPFLNEDVPTVEAAYQGARDIIAEIISDDAEIRRVVRSFTAENCVLACEQADPEADPERIYAMYYEYREPLAEIPPHRLLAINRGEREKALRVRLEVDEEPILAAIEKQYVRNPRSIFAGQIRDAIQDSYRRLIAPSIERELRKARTEEADEAAIAVFAANLRQLLLQPPVRGLVVMGIDPGYRTGCKVAIVDPTGRFLEGATIYPHEPHRRWDEAREQLVNLVIRHRVQAIAVGNGTASRETESLVAEVVAQVEDTAYVIVNEAGASVYSASPLAREELPDLDVAMRGAVSIARRLQDPLAELVKIEPKSIGVGLYQHDVDQKRLAQTLDAVVEDVVNYVGVDVNTASPALLRYVAGLNRRVANAIVAYRDAHGPFPTREALKQVPGLGEKAFEQAAGFLRIPGGENPLDNTAIHPESYPVVERLFARTNARGDEPDLPAKLEAFIRSQKIETLAQELDVGVPTLLDIIEALKKPGRDPRDALPAPILRRDVLSIDDLQPGMILRGTVRNVVPFGAFVDIGVKRDGLVHISEMADRYVRDPLEVVRVGDIVTVRVLEVDKERNRISLSLRI